MPLLRPDTTWRRLLQSALAPAWTQKSSTALFVPMTAAIDTTHLKEVRCALQLVGITSSFQGRPAYRMSDDGIAWSATETNIMVCSRQTSEGCFQCAAGAAEDNWFCWAVQNMAATSFLGALSRRYDCLQDLACCPKAAPEHFMSSEPGWVAEPMAWDPSVPC